MSCSVSEYDRGHDTVILSPGSQSDSCQIPHSLPPSLPPSLHLTCLSCLFLSLSLSFTHFYFRQLRLLVRLFHTWRFSPEFLWSWQALGKHRLISVKDINILTSYTSLLNKHLSLCRPGTLWILPNLWGSSSRFICVCDDSLISGRGWQGGASPRIVDPAIMFCWLDSWFMIAGFSPDSGFIVFCYKYIVVVLSLLATEFNLEHSI